MNVKPILFAAFLAMGSMTAMAQNTEAPATTTSQMNTIVESLTNNLAAYQQASGHSNTIMEAIYTDMKGAIHATKLSIEAQEPMTDSERRDEMAHFMQLEQAYAAVMNSQASGQTNKDNIVANVKEFILLLQ